MSNFETAKLVGAALLSTALPTMAYAEYCNDQNDKSAYSASSQWVAPVFGGPAGQFLYRELDLLEDGAMSSVEKAMLGKIVDALKQNGTELAVVVPVPRVLTADIDDLPAEDVFASYSALIAQLNEVGAYAPNLAAVYQQDQDSGGAL